MQQAEEIIQDELVRVAAAGALAARTAPKAKGEDLLVISVVSGKDKDELARHMEDIADQGYQARIFSRDAGNVRRAGAVLLIGTRHRTRGLDCGFCGFPTCTACTDAGGRCAYDLTDLGIAVGSAVSVVADHRADSRVMYTVGYAAVKQGLLGEEVSVALGVPLSGAGKNIFFDRKK